MASPPEVDELRKEVQAIRGDVARLGDLLELLAQRVAAVEAREPVLQTVAIPPPLPPAQAAPAVSAPQDATAAASAAAAGAAAVSSETRARRFEDLAWVLINRVGVVALVLGIGFFLKYAFDNDWIGPWGRVAIGILSGAVLLGIGEWQQQKQHAVFGQGMTGGGIAVLYLSFYAAFGFYKLIGATTAFALMALVTATCCVAAVRYRSLAIAVLALVGGFITPPVLSTGVDRQLALFAYVALLDAAALLLASREARWRILELLSLAGTVTMLQAWSMRFYADAKLAPTLAINALFLVGFGLFPALDARRRARRTDPRRAGDAPERRLAALVDMASLVIGGLYFVIVGWVLLHGYAPESAPQRALVLGGWLVRYPLRDWQGLAPLAFAAIHIGGLVLLRPQASAHRLLAGTHVSLAVLGFVLLVPAQFSGALVAVLWSVEIALIAVACAQGAARWPLVAACLLWCVALVWAGASDLDATARTALFSSMATAAYLCCAGSAWVIRWATRGRARWAWVTAAAMNFAVLLALSVEVHAWATRHSGIGYGSRVSAGLLALSVLWAAYGVGLAVAGFVRRQGELRALGLGLLVVTACKVFLFDLSTLAMAYRIFSFLALGVLFVAGSYVYLRAQRQRRAPEVREEGT